MDIYSDKIVDRYMGLFPEVRKEERPDSTEQDPRFTWKCSLDQWEFIAEKHRYDNSVGLFCDKYGLYAGYTVNEVSVAASHVLKARSKPVELLKYFKFRAPRIIRAVKKEDLCTFETRGMITLFDRIDKIKSKCLQVMAYFIYGLLSLLSGFSLPILDSVVTSVCKRRRETAIDRLSDKELDLRYVKITPSEKMSHLKEALKSVDENIEKLEKAKREKGSFFF